MMSGSFLRHAGFWSLSALLFGGSTLSAQQVIRGPYLQIGTPTSIVVRWRTDIPTESVVRYGVDPSRLDKQMRTAGLTTEHIVPLASLAPSTRYHYSVGNVAGPLAASAVDMHFVTSSPPGTRGPVRMWVIGDAGTASAPGYGRQQAAVRDAYYAFTGGRRTDLFLMLGDNAYKNGTDAENQIAVFDMYRDLLRQTVVWPTLGNHDADSATSITQSGVYFDLFTLPTQGQAGGLMSGTEAYYSFDYANIHFVCLDSSGRIDRSLEGPMFTWLKHDLASTLQEWIIAYWHHPPYSKGSHDSNTEPRLGEMRAKALPMLEAAGVDLVLSGHSHTYERSFLLDGHYGKSDSLTSKMKRDPGDGRAEGSGEYRKPAGLAAHEGAVYVVAGSSGKTSGRENKEIVARGLLDHPAMVVSLYRLGSLVLDLEGDRLDATFLDEKGTRLDWFTVTKGKPARTSKPVPQTTATAMPPSPPVAPIAR